MLARKMTCNAHVLQHVPCSGHPCLHVFTLLAWSLYWVLPDIASHILLCISQETTILWCWYTGHQLLCLDRWSSALQTCATTLLLWGLRGLSGAAHYPLFPLSPLSPSPFHLRKSASACGQPNIFMSDWTRRLAVNASHNMALKDLLIDLQMPGKLRLWQF